MQATAASGNRRDLDEQSAEVEHYRYARTYSKKHDFYSRSREPPSFRINECSLALVLDVWYNINDIILYTL